MANTQRNWPLKERLLSAEEVAELIGVSTRTVLALPIRRILIGTRTIRFVLNDVYGHLGIADPASQTTETS
jgi:hypothetical protein